MYNMNQKTIKKAIKWFMENELMIIGIINQAYWYSTGNNDYKQAKLIYNKILNDINNSIKESNKNEFKVDYWDEDKIVFTNGIEITDYHDQDCCEHVYADWKQLEDTEIKNRIFNDIKIEPIKDSGFRLNGFFVPCYDEQNGYYSNNLELTIEYPDGKKKTIDISDCTKKDYC